MNTIITNLPLIADAAEYFDRRTMAAWRIRSSITSSLVWAANSLVNAMKGDDPAIIQRAQIVMATLRCWMRDCNQSSFVLDLTPPAVRKTLGLDKEIDVHAEACKQARQKCMQLRSASRFKEFYDKAVLQLTMQRAKREENVAEISDILADSGFVLHGEFTDMRGYTAMYSEEFVSDEELYDDESVIVQTDRLAEVIGNALEAMYEVCDADLANAITSSKISRLTGYMTGITAMFPIVGVDTHRMAERKSKLEAQIAALEGQVNKSNEELQAEISAQVDELVEQATQPTPAETRRHHVKSPERLAREAADAEAAQARAAEDELKAKRSAAGKKAAQTRKAKKLSDMTPEEAQQLVNGLAACL